MVLINSTGLGAIKPAGRVLLSIFRTIDRCQGKKRGPKYIAGSMEEWLVLDELPKIKPSVLIIWGQNDLYLPVSQAELAHRSISGSSLQVFPRCGHAPQREYPDKFNRLVIQFLAEQVPQGE